MRHAAGWILLGVCILPGGCAQPAGEVETPLRLECTEWPAADRLFHQDPRWRGADDAHSVDLGGDRILWLFADGFIHPAGTGRPGSAMIRNSIGIQTGRDPSQARIDFAWREAAGKPASFFPEAGRVWHWPGDGIRIEDRLLVFLMQVKSSPVGLGFAVTGWTAVLVPNPDDPPREWRLESATLPPPRDRIIAASGGLAVEDGHLLAWSTQEGADHDVFLMRWPQSAARDGRLADPEWWCGEDLGWRADAHPRCRPAVVIPSAQTEFTVHRDGPSGLWLQVQTLGFGATEIGLRQARRATGPFSAPQSFHRPRESDRPGLLVYAGKAHPELTGAGLVLTYVANHTDFASLIGDSSIYYPRFLRARIER